MDTLKLTNAQARRFLLAHQNLWPPRQLEGKAGVLDHIRHVGCIQFDPLNVVGRNPELVLQARVSDFRPTMLNELLYQDRALLDGWDRMMSIYSVDDWPYFRRRRERARRHPGKSPEAVESVLSEVRQALEERGPLSSIDLDMGQTVDWSWGPTRLARAALESMWSWGELVIHHKVNTRRVYDLARRHLPQELLSAPDPNGTEEAYHDWYTYRRIGSAGLLGNRANASWRPSPVAHRDPRQAAIARLLAQDLLVEVQVEGIKPLLYMRRDDRATLERVLDSDPAPPQATVIAPLDNLIWDRRLVEELFGFRYRWEVYTPVAKREFGYYVLPVLYGDRFVARFEPGRNKESGALIVKNWWWEQDASPTESMRADLRQCFQRFLTFLGSEKLQVDVETVEKAGLDWLTPLAGQ